MKEEQVIAKTNQQILHEAGGACQATVAADGVHSPLEPLPDVDWVGETWGLFWPDIENEMDENKEDPAKFLKKHYPDPKAAGAPARPTETATVTEALTPLLCPEAPKPTKAATPPPAVKLRHKNKTPPPPTPKLASPPRLEVFEGPQDIDNDNSKWGWMRSDDSSASKARFRLSIFW